MVFSRGMRYSQSSGDPKHSIAIFVCASATHDFEMKSTLQLLFLLLFFVSCTYPAKERQSIFRGTYASMQCLLFEQGHYELCMASRPTHAQGTMHTRFLVSHAKRSW